MAPSDITLAVPLADNVARVGLRAGGRYPVLDGGKLESSRRFRRAQRPATPYGLAGEAIDEPGYRPGCSTR